MLIVMLTLLPACSKYLLRGKILNVKCILFYIISSGYANVMYYWDEGVEIQRKHFLLCLHDLIYVHVYAINQFSESNLTLLTTPAM
jgi:hypothetical protein